MSLTKLLLVMSFFSALNAHADQTASDFKQMARSIPQALLAKGYSDFGRLRLETLLSSIDTTETRSTGMFHRSEKVIEGFKTARSGAEWKLKSKGASVNVNRVMWSRSARPIQSVLALHEILGVNQFNDRNYQLSTSLWLLSLPETDRALKPDEKQKIADRIRVASGGGGIAGVGGGGDGEGVRMRLAMLKRDLAQIAKARNSEQRNAGLQALDRDFGISAEVRWADSKTKSIEIEITPIDRVDEVDHFKACTSLINADKKMRGMVFDYLQKHSPQVVERFGSLNGLVNHCQMLLSAR